MSVRLRLNLILLACFALGLLCSAAYFRAEARRVTTEAIEYEARLHMQTAMAVRKFTMDELMSRTDFHADAPFLDAAIPAFAARETLARLYRDYPGYVYREAALNPTRPANLATGPERELLMRYREGRADGEQLWTDHGPDGDVLHIARPVTIRDASCLRCHGTSAGAPASLRAAYPGGGGFGWRLGETVAAQIVSMPLAQQEARARRMFSSFVLSMGIVFALLMAALNVLLGRMVLSPLGAANAALDRLADTDALTGLFNRRAFDRRLEDALRASRRGGQPLSLVAFDLDHFKRINDDCGHEAGDRVLVRIAGVVRDAVRPQDTLARTGGEEFVIVRVGDGQAQACAFAEGLRARVRGALAQAPGPVTASFGVAQWDGTEAAAALLARTDGALYEAKRAGRDRVACGG